MTLAYQGKEVLPACFLTPNAELSAPASQLNTASELFTFTFTFTASLTSTRPPCQLVPAGLDECSRVAGTTEMVAWDFRFAPSELLQAAVRLTPADPLPSPSRASL